MALLLLPPLEGAEIGELDHDLFHPFCSLIYLAVNLCLSLQILHACPALRKRPLSLLLLVQLVSSRTSHCSDVLSSQPVLFCSSSLHLLITFPSDALVRFCDNAM